MLSPIVDYRIVPYKIPIHVPFAIAKDTMPSAEGCFIQVIDSEGVSGWGEAAPFPALTQDNATKAAQHAKDLIETIKGFSPSLALNHLAQLMDESFSISRTAYVGVESALWDLQAKILGKPLSSLWGTATLDAVTTDITLPIMEPDRIHDFWERYAPFQFPVVKVKVSGHVDSDCDMIVTLVRTIGYTPDSQIRLTLDGNQGFHVASACALVSTLHRHKIYPEFFEQPLPAHDFKGLHSLKNNLPIPVCVDETVQNQKDAERVIEERLASIINLKIMKSGIGETLQILRKAQACGVSLMIGGMLETEIAMGISLQIACGAGGLDYIDLDTPFFLTKPSSTEGPWLSQKAVLRKPHTPGHGIAIAPEWRNGSTPFLAL